MKKVLVINANPKSNSLSKSIADHYAQVAGVKNEVKKINIGDMNFNVDLSEGYDVVMPLEPDLLNFQRLIEWAEHIVIVSPVWWGGVSAKFKGLIDRTFLPGFAFKYIEGKSIPKKLLAGRTSELIFTLDTPPFWYKYVQGNPIYKNLKHTILAFSGIKNVSATYFGPVINSNKKTIDNWFKKVEKRASKVQ